MSSGLLDTLEARQTWTLGHKSNSTFASAGLSVQGSGPIEEFSSSVVVDSVEKRTTTLVQ